MNKPSNQTLTVLKLPCTFAKCIQEVFICRKSKSGQFFYLCEEHYNLVEKGS